MKFDMFFDTLLGWPQEVYKFFLETWWGRKRLPLLKKLFSSLFLTWIVIMTIPAIVLMALCYLCCILSTLLILKPSTPEELFR